jgi:hypothetical protein
MIFKKILSLLSEEKDKKNCEREGCIYDLIENCII